MSTIHDVIVIGSDEMAIATAIEAGRRGLDVLMIEETFGGPAQGAKESLLLRSKIREAISHRLAVRGLLEGVLNSSPVALLPERGIAVLRRRIAERYLPGVERPLAAFGVRKTSGSVRFASPNRVLLGPRDILTAPIIVIAVGTRPRHPGRFKFDQRTVCDEWGVFRFSHPPRQLLIVGAEAAGLELACIFHALGSGVTLLDRRQQALRYVDREIRQLLCNRLHAMGIELIFGEGLDRIRIREPAASRHAEAILSSGRVENCDRVLIEAGRTPNTEELGLCGVGIETDDRGFIIIDEHQRTSQPGVYAVGSATGNTNAAHLQQPRLAIQHAMGERVDPPESTPITIYTTPPISMLGWTAEMCERLDLQHVVGIARYCDLPSPRALDGGEGMLKLVVTRGDRRLTGIHAIGEGASEVVQVGAALASSGADVDELARCPFAAHTSFEAYLVAAQDALKHLAPKGRRQLDRREGRRSLLGSGESPPDRA